VLFKAFTTDEFVKRPTCARRQRRRPVGRCLLMLDEPHQPGGRIEFDRVIRYQEVDLGVAEIKLY
jgi:hypothetical protein